MNGPNRWHKWCAAWENGATTKDGPGGATNAVLLALTPEAPEAPVNHAPLPRSCQQGAL